MSANDSLNIIIPEDLRKCREQALKLASFGSLEGTIPVKIDSRTTIFKKVKK